MPSLTFRPRRVVPTILGALAVMAAMPVAAQTFEPYYPPACASGWSDTVPWTYRMGFGTNFGDPTTERANIPSNPNKPCTGGACDYIPNVHQTRAFVTNQWVNRVRFKDNMLRTEPTNDFFQVRLTGVKKAFAPMS